MLYILATYDNDIRSDVLIISTAWFILIYIQVNIWWDMSNQQRL